MDASSIRHRSQMPGNPARIGDGCATVTGYKLPQPLVTSREGGSEVGDLKSGYRFGCARRGRSFWAANFSVQEKDEASFLDRFQGDSLNAFILRFWRGLKVFCLDRW